MSPQKSAGQNQPTDSPTPPDRPLSAPTNPASKAAGSKAHLYGRVAVLSIGIARYQSPGIPELAYPVADATAIAEHLRDSFGFEPTLLIGPEATKRAIETALDQCEEHLGERDALILYFAGHGQLLELPSYGRAGYLIPYDADLDLQDRSRPAQWQEEAIDAHWLVERVERMPAQHVVLVADACFSGYMTTRGSNLWDRPDLQEIPKFPSRSVVAATTERQGAREDRKSRHGIFTAALLAQLEELDRDKHAASVTDVFVEVRQRVTDDSRRSMTPQMSRTGEGEFVFLPLSIPRADVEALLGGVLKRWAARAAQRTTLHEVIEAFQAPDYRFSTDPGKQEVEWLEKRRRFEGNAVLGDPLAMAALHYCLSKGLGTEKDSDAAYSWALKAYKSGHAAGKHVFGRCLSAGIGVPKNEKASIELFRAAAEEGFPVSRFSVAKVTLLKLEAERRGETVLFEEGEVERMRAHLSAAAEAGHDLAVRSVASLTMDGRGGFARDPAKAVRLLEDYTRNGPQASASVYLASLLQAGIPDVIQPNRERSAALLRQSAAAGYAQAQCEYAVALLNGLGVREDKQEAFFWADLADRQDYPPATFLVAKMHLNGWGTPKDTERAVHQLEKGDALGVADATFLLGFVHWDESYGRRDRDKALTYFLRAGERGVAEGWYFAGGHYLDKYYEWRSSRMRQLLDAGVTITEVDKHLDDETDFNSDADRATLYFLRAARKGHRLAESALLGNSPFGRPALLERAERELDGKP
jgi:TPR repeat protein